VDDAKRSDRDERLALLTVQFTGSPPVSHDLAVTATRQVDMATEGAPAIIVAGVDAVAATSRSAIAVE
jgi:hypothetical protein